MRKSSVSPGKKCAAALAVAAALAAALFFIILQMKPAPYDPHSAYQSTFKIQIPPSSPLLYAERDFGGMGDGEALYIFKPSPEDMQSILNSYSFDAWNRLPLGGDLKNSPAAGEAAALLGLQGGFFARDGFYLCVDVNFRPQKDPRDLRDYYLSIIDVNSGVICFYIYFS